MKIKHLKLVGLFVVAMGLLSVLAAPKAAQASGGVGSGGSGGCGSCGSYNTNNGWGWVSYATNSAGPTGGFRNGALWSDVQSTCQNANASTVYAHIIMNPNGDGKVYDYWSAEDDQGWPGHFGPGWTVDHGKAVSMDTWVAQNAYNTLPSYGVDTTGFTFGSNVAWFCYDFAPRNTVASGTVYVNGAPTSGIGVGFCAGNNHTTDGNGFFTSDSFNPGQSYCVRGFVPWLYRGSNGNPIAQRNSNATIGDPDYAGDNHSGDVDPAYGFPVNPYPTYEWQDARADCYHAGTPGNYFCPATHFWYWDRNYNGNYGYGDFGYDFNYDANPYGVFDSADCTSAAGWALDPDTDSSQINVAVYVDGTDNAHGIGWIPTSGLRQDVNNYYNGLSGQTAYTGNLTGNHGWSWTIPSNLKDGVQHTIYIYAINVGRGNANPLIGSKKITCSTPPPPPPPPPPTFICDLMTSSASGMVPGTNNFTVSIREKNNSSTSSNDAITANTKIYKNNSLVGSGSGSYPPPTPGLGTKSWTSNPFSLSLVNGDIIKISGSVTDTTLSTTDACPDISMTATTPPPPPAPPSFSRDYLGDRPPFF